MNETQAILNVLALNRQNNQGIDEFIAEFNNVRNLLGGEFSHDTLNDVAILEEVLLDDGIYDNPPDVFIRLFNNNKQYADFLISQGFNPSGRRDSDYLRGDTLLHICARIIRSTFRDYYNLLGDVGPDYTNNILNNCYMVIAYLINEHRVDYDALNDNGERMQDLCNYQPLIDYIDRFRDRDNALRLPMQDVRIRQRYIPDDILRRVEHYY